MSQIDVDIVAPFTGTTVTITGDLVTNITNAAVLGTDNTGELTVAYTNYVAKITQLLTGAPTASVFSNTIGAIVWTRVAVGSYEGTLTGAFSGNTHLLFNNPLSTRTVYFYNASDADKIYIDSIDIATGLPADYDSDELYIEVKVY